MLKTSTNPAFISLDWPVDKVLAFSTTRLSPTQPVNSHNQYQHFNLAQHVGDNEQSVQANRKLLLEYLPEKTTIQWLNQVHSADVIVADKLLKAVPDADAIITRTPNLAIAIMTADCLPIILADRSGHEIAVIHAGWRPLVSGIITHTLEKMKTSPKNLCAWLGPCISNQYFEVGIEVKAQFIQRNKQFESAFKYHKEGKYLADLHRIAEYELLAAGLVDIDKDNRCTYAQHDTFYSYRREQITGRMATLACLLP